MRYKNKTPNYFRNLRVYDKNISNLPSINNIQNLCRINRNYNLLSKLPKISFRHKKLYRKRSKFNIKSPNIIFLILGALLFLFGIIGVISNTVVFTPMFMRGAVGGVSFGLTSILLFLGIAIVFFRRKSALGYGLITIGILTICVSVFSSLRVGFLPTSLLKTILIFAAVFAGLGFILKWIYKNIRH